MSQRDQNIAQFFTALDATPELWRSLDIRTIAVCLNGVWHNLLTRIRADSREQGEIGPPGDLPEHDLVACWQDVLPFESLPALLAGILSGKHTVADRELLFVQMNADGRASAEPYSEAWSQLKNTQNSASRVNSTRHFIAHRLELRSGRAGASLAQLAGGGTDLIRDILEAADKPFDGVDGLARIALESSVQPSQQNQALVEVIAPLGVSLQRQASGLEQGVLSVTLWAASKAAANASSVGFVAERDDGTYLNGTIRVPQEAWTGERDQIGHAVHPLGVAARHVSLLVRVGPHVVDRDAFADTRRITANPHLLLHQQLDPGFRALRRTLTTTEKQATRNNDDAARRFEIAVARIFSMAGLHTDVLGKSGGVQHAFDVLARTPDGSFILAVECTLGPLASSAGKPGRLIGRVHELVSLPEVGHAKVLSVMATARPRGSLPKSEIQAAAQDGIALLFQEDLLELIHLLERGADVGDIVARCEKSVPIVPRATDQVFWPHSL